MNFNTIILKIMTRIFKVLANGTTDDFMTYVESRRRELVIVKKELKRSKIKDFFNNYNEIIESFGVKSRTHLQSAVEIEIRLIDRLTSLVNELMKVGRNISSYDMSLRAITELTFEGKTVELTFPAHLVRTNTGYTYIKLKNAYKEKSHDVGCIFIGDDVMIIGYEDTLYYLKNHLNTLEYASIPKASDIWTYYGILFDFKVVVYVFFDEPKG